MSIVKLKAYTVVISCSLHHIVHFALLKQIQIAHSTEVTANQNGCSGLIDVMDVMVWLRMDVERGVLYAYCA